MRTRKTPIVGFCHRFSYAALFSAMIWIGAFLPLPEGTYPPTKVGIRNTVLIWFDLPIAVATQILPCDEFAIDLWFTVRGGELCPGNGGGRTQFFVNHMRVGILTYMLIFYLPAIFRAGRGWWKRRRLRQGRETWDLGDRSWLFRDLRPGVIMRAWRMTLSGFSHRFAYAALISAIVRIGYQLPLPEGTYPPTKWGGPLWCKRPACNRSSRDGCTTKDLRDTVLTNFLLGCPLWANYCPPMTVRNEFAPEWRV